MRTWSVIGTPFALCTRSSSLSMRTRMSMQGSVRERTLSTGVHGAAPESSPGYIPVMRTLLVLAALLLGAAPALSVAPGTNGGIVFAAGDALGRGSVLELADANGIGGAHTLTPRSLDAAMPAVSPDGKRIAFASLRRKGGGIF